MWEYFLDASYYDMWAVRNTSDKSFTSAIHVMTEDEAKFLVEKLNELQKLQAGYSDYHDLYYGGTYTYSQPADITDYHDSLVDPIKKLIESHLELPAEIKKKIDDDFSKILGDKRKQEAPAEPLVSCHDCGSTAGYYSLGKACKNCNCVA